MDRHEANQIKGAVALLLAFEMDQSKPGHVTSACIILQRLIDVEPGGI